MARIPNSTDASSMWKMNDVYVAESGGEWIDSYVPYIVVENFIKRQKGTWDNLTDGTTTNTWPVANPSIGYQLSAYTVWNQYYGSHAISFNVASSYATTYKITRFGIGAISTDTVGAINPYAIYLQLIAGTTTGGTSLYKKTYPAWNLMLTGYGSSYASAYGANLLTLPTDDSGNPPPTLNTNTDYVAVYANAGTQGYQMYGGSDFLSTRQITPGTGGSAPGTVDITYSNVTSFNGSGYLGTDLGTDLTNGPCHVIFGIEI